MEFLKSSELELNPAGYLVSKKSGKPVAHAAFVKQQQAAEYFVKLAEAIKDKTFKCGKIDNIEEIKREVRAAIAGNATRSYVDAPSKPTSKVQDELTKFALDWDNFEDDKAKADKVNQIMNEFNTISDVENVGDYFQESVVKLGAIYDVKTILAAVQIHQAKLG